MTRYGNETNGYFAGNVYDKKKLADALGADLLRERTSGRV